MEKKNKKKQKRLDYSLLLLILFVMTPLVSLIDPARDSRLCSICIRAISIFQFPCTLISVPY